MTLPMLLLIPPFLVLPPLRVPVLPLIVQDEELHQFGLSVHVEDEDDDKYVGGLNSTTLRVF